MVSFVHDDTLACTDNFSVKDPFLSLPSFPPIATIESVTFRSSEVQHGPTGKVSAPKSQALVVEESARDAIRQQYVLLEMLANYANL
jgi:hypothetical protein